MKEVYQVLSGVLGLEKRMTQISNNLANTNTIGFKRDGSAFNDYFKELTAQAGGGVQAPGGGDSANPASSVWPTLGSTYVDYTPGLLRPTEQDLDVAIGAKDGFFQVRVEGTKEVFYTRAGNFRIDDDQYLVTIDGRRVLDQGGREIKMDLKGNRANITVEGKIMAGQEEIGTIGVVQIEDPSQLVRHGQGLFRAPEDMKKPTLHTEPVLRQGFIEGSNVNPIEEMIAMIRVERAYQVQQKVVQQMEELTSRRIEQAVN